MQNPSGLSSEANRIGHRSSEKDVKELAALVERLCQSCGEMFRTIEILKSEVAQAKRTAEDAKSEAKRSGRR